MTGTAAACQTFHLSDCSSNSVARIIKRPTHTLDKCSLLSDFSADIQSQLHAIQTNIKHTQKRRVSTRPSLHARRGTAESCATYVSHLPDASAQPVNLFLVGRLQQLPLRRRRGASRRRAAPVPVLRAEQQRAVVVLRPCPRFHRALWGVPSRG